MRKLIGTVVSNKMKKTVVVEVGLRKTNKKYRTNYEIEKRFKAHDENGEYSVGDKVVIEETRPMSREKRWRVVQRVVNKSQTS
jgi:small subunit ribosomal protein S17